MHHHRNLAARMGAWSAMHRRIAVLGWIAFVVAATVAGGAIGQQKLEAYETYNGDSRVAEEAIDRAGFQKAANEQVLIQGRDSIAVDSPEFTAAVRDVVARLGRTEGVQEVVSPLDAPNQVAEDGPRRS